jgi:methanogenic corrinoid protein MtbC1
MRMSTQNGSMQESGNQVSSSSSRWEDGESYGLEPGAAAAEVTEQGAEVRMALLARAIQNEIIPRLMLAHRVPDACLEVPTLPAGTEQVGLGDVENFARIVLSQGEDRVLACVEAMRERGVPVETIYLDLLAPAARYLGELWEQDLCDFTDVTLGLGRLQQVLRELSPVLGQCADYPANGPRILLLPAPGEKHTFGLIMVAEFFRRAGWDVAGGPWEPDANPAVMVRREWFDVVGFSVASDMNLPELGDCIAAVRKASMNPHLGIMVGGPVFTSHPEYVTMVQADCASGDGSQAPLLAKQLISNRAGRG